MSIQMILLILAIICFILAAAGVSLGVFSIGWIGLALFAGAHIPGNIH